MLALDPAPTSKLLLVNKASVMNTIRQTMATSSGGGLLPGASALPPAIGSKLTVRNALFGAAAVAAVGAIYFWFLPPKKKAGSTAPASSAAKAVAGLFGIRRRRRRRR